VRIAANVGLFAKASVTASSRVIRVGAGCELAGVAGCGVCAELEPGAAGGTVEGGVGEFACGAGASGVPVETLTSGVVPAVLPEDVSCA